MIESFGIKELYDVSIKSTYPIEINGKIIEPGENLVFFDSVQIAEFREINSTKNATGGFDNRSHIVWETTKQINFRFTKGIFSQIQYAIMNNAKLIEKKEGELIEIPRRQILESNEKGQLTLKEIPLKTPYVYEKSNGEKLNIISIEENVLTIAEPFKDVIVDYVFPYEEGATTMSIGNKLIEGYVTLEGRTRVKDDVTGQTKTGIVRIPKMRIMSDLFIRLGEKASPLVGDFSACGYPVGVKGSAKAMEIIFLENDIDSDI